MAATLPGSTGHDHEPATAEGISAAWGTVELRAHAEEWASIAKLEADRLVGALGPERIAAVHHIGSTAIPGILAKPIVDLLAEAPVMAALDGAAELFRILGYRWLGEHGIPGRRYCTLDDPVTGRRIVHLHCFLAGCAQIDSHLVFRDHLRAHPVTARAYESEKLRCAARWPHDRQAYTAGKAAWIEATVQEALAARGHETS